MIGCDLLSAAVVALMASAAVPVPVLLALLFCLGLISPVAAGMRNTLLAVVLPAGVVHRRALALPHRRPVGPGRRQRGGRRPARASRHRAGHSRWTARASSARPCSYVLRRRRARRSRARPTRSRAPASSGTRSAGCRPCSPTGASGACCCSAGSSRVRRGARVAGGAVRRGPGAVRRRPSAGGSPRSRRARSRASSPASGSCRRPGGCGLMGVLAAATFVPLLGFAGEPGAGGRAAAARRIRRLQRMGARSGRADPGGHARAPARPCVQRQHGGVDLAAGIRLRRRGRARGVRPAARRDRHRRAHGARGGRRARSGHPRSGPARLGRSRQPRYSDSRAAPPGAPPSCSRAAPNSCSHSSLRSRRPRGVRGHDVHVHRPRLRPRRGHGAVRRSGLRAAGLDAPADPGPLLPGHDARAERRLAGARAAAGEADAGASASAPRRRGRRRGRERDARDPGAGRCHGAQGRDRLLAARRGRRGARERLDRPRLADRDAAAGR